MRFITTLALLSVLAACARAPEPAESVDAAPPEVEPATQETPVESPFRLIVGSRQLHPAMGLAGLRERFGEESVVPGDLPLGEGETEPGAWIHPDDPSRRAAVYFVGGRLDGHLAAIQIRDPESIWEGPFGLRMGLSLTDIERLNGGPLRFLGFGWDYGGTVSHFLDGSLGRAFLDPGRLALRLVEPEQDEAEKLPSGYPRGDAEFPSDLAVLRQHPPKVGEFGLVFIDTRAPLEPPVEDSDDDAEPD